MRRRRPASPAAPGTAPRRYCRWAGWWPGGRRKLPASPLPAAATRALGGQFRDPRRAAGGSPPGSAAQARSPPCPERESLAPRAGICLAGLGFLSRQWVTTLGLSGVRAGVGSRVETPCKREVGFAAGGGRWHPSASSRSAQSRAARPECATRAEPALCHRLFLVTNSSPWGALRLHPRETGEEEVRRAKGRGRGQMVEPWVPLVFTFVPPGTRRWGLG